ncbi:hypothetical protein [Cellulomonas chengniuliangii]|uniref:Uncharacterized protein n=1 Tax=Cellulomonas chengniuliangii TaxID=2968084 RepID=A0ABY5KWR6_9CELL|nr:hypothetical protein [Cellulomonas chengniuliangii]MCC2309803.1 hypothetical protein [Cellulomonas chengniuliangii]MCC2319095.1 hypothetical protein [Cellulomonas chengniuliangii]UUI74654.1 hypothetical protein NP064_12775 [Cellulomonas chengniuliangii]
MSGMGNRAARMGSSVLSVKPAVKSSNPNTLNSASRPNVVLSAIRAAADAQGRRLIEDFAAQAGVDLTRQ